MVFCFRSIVAIQRAQGWISFGAICDHGGILRIPSVTDEHFPVFNQGFAFVPQGRRLFLVEEAVRVLALLFSLKGAQRKKM